MPYVGKCYGKNKVWKGIGIGGYGGMVATILNKFNRESLKK